MEKKNENLKYILSRYDIYINASNVKGTFLVALNTFIVGCILINKNSISEILKDNYCIQSVFDVILYLICLSAISILFFTIRALFPFLTSGNSTIDKYHSHIYFGSVIKFKNPKEYRESFDNLNDEDYEIDLTNQIYILSKGLSMKYQMLNNAMWIVYFELMLFVITMILILIK